MSLEALVAELERESRARGEALLAEARERAGILRREARRRRERLERERLEAELRRLEEAAATREAAARAEARRKVLEARARYLDRLFRAASERFPEVVTGPAYRKVLPAHLEEALRYLEREEQGIEVVVPPVLEAPLGGIVGSREDVRLVVEESCPPGLLARTADGEVVVDNTLPGRLERRQEELAMELMARFAADDRATDGTAGKAIGGTP